MRDYVDNRQWAARNDGFLIEDDYDSEFRYDREPVGLLQGLAPDRVFAIGTVSKSLAPAVRLGWVVVPPPLVDAVAAEKRVSDRGSSGLDQLAVAALLESGRYDRHLRHMRAVYARRRGVLIDSLARHAPGVRLTGLAAGFHAVAHLPDSADEQAVVTAARQRSVGGVRASGARCRAADPVEARPGTIRGDGALDVIYNVVAGSGSPESTGQHIKNVLSELVNPFRPAGVPSLPPYRYPQSTSSAADRFVRRLV